MSAALARCEQSLLEGGPHRVSRYAVCALAGLSGIGFRRFMVIATVGRIPAVAFGVFTMAGLEGRPGMGVGDGRVRLCRARWGGCAIRPPLERRLVQKVGRQDGARTKSDGEQGHAEGDDTYPERKSPQIDQVHESVRLGAARSHRTEKESGRHENGGQWYR